MNMSIFKKRLLLIWTILLLLFKPSVVGERFNPLIFFLFISTTCLLFIIDNENNKRYMNKRNVFAFLLILLTAVYFLFQGLLLSNAKSTVINSIVVIFGTSICIVYVSRKDNVPIILRTFINIFFWLSLSAVTTAVIFIFCGLDYTKIPVVANLNFFVHGYGKSNGTNLGSHLLFFPFTLVWSSFNIGGFSLPRFIGIFREPGMAQLFFITAYFLTYFVETKKVKLKRFVILLGSFLTFSTAGLLSFLGGLLMLKLFGKGKIPSLTMVTTTIISLTSIIIIFATIPNLGLLNKMSSASGKERSKSFENSLKILSESPIVGTGYYNGFRINHNDEVGHKDFLGLGLIGVAYEIGIIGLILYLILWYYGLFRLGNIQTLCIYMPCLLTLMFSQPSFNDVIVFFLILTDTSNMKLINYQTRLWQICFYRQFEGINLFYKYKLSTKKENEIKNYLCINL